MQNGGRRLKNARAAFFSIGCALITTLTGLSASGGSRYVTDTGGRVVRNATYLCWHTGDWTPAAALAECDPDLVAKPLAAKAANTANAEPRQAQSANRPHSETMTIPAEALFDSDKWT